MFLTSKLTDELRCPICLELFKNPRTLTCQHSFCENCLIPLVRKKIFDCPQCRKVHSSKSCRAEDFPKNSLLVNLVEALKDNSSKAMCPQCKSINDVQVCDHCSEIFCEECQSTHFKSILSTAQSRIEKIESLPAEILKRRASIEADRTSTLNQTIDQMNQIQSRILEMWNGHKTKLVTQILQFYEKKTQFLNAAEFRINLSKKNCDDLKRDKKSLEARAQTASGNVGNKKELCEGLIGFERDLRLQEEKLHEILIFSSQASAFAKNKALDSKKLVLTNTDNPCRPLMYCGTPKRPANCLTLFNLAEAKLNKEDNSKLELNLNEFDYMEIFEKILKNIYLETKFDEDKSFMPLDEDINQSKLLKIEDIFGKPVVFFTKSELDGLTLIQNLKTKVSKKLSIPSECICFIESKTGVELSDDTKLVVRENQGENALSLGIFRFLDIGMALDSLDLSSNKPELYLTTVKVNK